MKQKMKLQNLFVLSVLLMAIGLISCREVDFKGSYTFQDKSSNNWQLDIDDNNEAFIFQPGADFSYQGEWSKVTEQKATKDTDEVAYAVIKFTDHIPNICFTAGHPNTNATLYLKNNMLYDNITDMNNGVNGIPMEKHSLVKDNNQSYVDEYGQVYYPDDQGQPYYMDENGEYYYLDENGQPYYVAENGQYYYLDENGQPYYIDENGQYYYFDANGQPYYPN